MHVRQPLLLNNPCLLACKLRELPSHLSHMFLSCAAQVQSLSLPFLHTSRRSSAVAACGRRDRRGWLRVTTAAG